HDVFLTAGFLSSIEVPIPATELIEGGRGTWASIGIGIRDPGSGIREVQGGLIPECRIPNPGAVLIAAERLPEFFAVHPNAQLDPPIIAPPLRAARIWGREEAIVELLRGRLSMVGPTTASELAASLAITTTDADAALLTLEAEGEVLGGTFCPRGANPEPE